VRRTTTCVGKTYWQVSSERKEKSNGGSSVPAAAAVAADAGGYVGAVRGAGRDWLRRRRRELDPRTGEHGVEPELAGGAGRRRQGAAGDKQRHDEHGLDRARAERRRRPSAVDG